MVEPGDVRRLGHEPRRNRRGVSLLPSILTLGNMFCGYACILYAMRGHLDTAAPLLGIVSHRPPGDWLIGLPFFFCALLQATGAFLAIKHFKRQRAARPSTQA